VCAVAEGREEVERRRFAHRRPSAFVLACEVEPAVRLERVARVAQPGRDRHLIRLGLRVDDFEMPAFVVLDTERAHVAEAEQSIEAQVRHGAFFRRGASFAFSVSSA
jgi:hypothetical protein